MIKRFAIMVLLLAVLFGGVFGWQWYKGKMIARFMASQKPPPVTVSASEAVAQTWTVYFGSVGTLTAVNDVNVTTEVGGRVDRILFESSQDVRKGDLLVKLDDSVNQAEMKSQEAALALARVNFQRGRELYERRNFAEASLDQARATLEQAEAEVARTRAVIEQKQIRAPFDGRLGIRRVNLGQYVSPGDGLVWLQSIDRVYADFPVPEGAITRITPGLTVLVNVDAYPGRVFEGKVTSIDSKVNEATRNIMVRATLQNPKRELFPGMFANVRVVLPERAPVVTVPETAVAYGLYGDSVFVIRQSGEDEAGKPVLEVERRTVKLGDRQHGYAAIAEGVQAGERVVTSGQLKLQNGARVAIDPNVDMRPPEILPKE